MKNQIECYITVSELLLKERWTDNILFSLMTFSYSG